LFLIDFYKYFVPLGQGGNIFLNQALALKRKANCLRRFAAGPFSSKP